MAGLVHAAHTLAGSASMFGYVRLCSLCREFERGRDEPAAGRSRLVRDLRAALEHSMIDFALKQDAARRST